MILPVMVACVACWVAVDEKNCVTRAHSVKVEPLSLEWTVALFMSPFPEHTSTGSDEGSESANTSYSLKILYSRPKQWNKRDISFHMKIKFADEIYNK